MNFQGDLSRHLLALGLLLFGSAQVVSAQATVVVWGNNTSGQQNVPEGLTNVAAIATGGGTVLAMKHDGTLVAWGASFYGQTNIPSDLTNVVWISAGERHCLAVQSDGQVAAWGDDSYGQTNVPAELTDVAAVAAGGSHGGFSLALKRGGAAEAWGQYLSPTGMAAMYIPDGLAEVVALAAGDTHSLALKSDGTLVAWGGFITNVPIGLSNVVAISAGEAHNLALKRDGTVVAWGRPSRGETNVPPGLSNIVAIASGRWHCLVLKADGTVAAWGTYHDGTYYQTMTAPAGLSNVTAIAAGLWNCAAIIGGHPQPFVPAGNPRMSDGAFRLSFSAQSGRVYQVEHKDSLGQENWIAQSLLLGAGGTVDWVDAAATNMQRYYRLRRW